MKRKNKSRQNLQSTVLKHENGLTAMMPADDLFFLLSGMFGTLFNTVRDGHHKVKSVSPSFEEVSFSFVRFGSMVIFESADFNEFVEVVVARTLLMSQTAIILESDHLVPHSKFAYLYNREVQGWMLYDNGHHYYSMTIREVRSWDTASGKVRRTTRYLKAVSLI